MYVLNEYMEFGVDTPHIATYNFKLVFHLLFSTIYSIKQINIPVSSSIFIPPLSPGCYFFPSAEVHSGHLRDY